MPGIEIVTRVGADKRHEFLQAFELFRKPEMWSGDCLSRNLFEEIARPEYFLWQERWRSEDALEAYMTSETYRALIGALKVLGKVELLQRVYFSAGPDDRGVDAD